MKYVKLTAKPDTWFVPGTEVWHYDHERRLTTEEWDSWNNFIVLVCGIRECDESFSYEKEYMEKHNTRFRLDGESCGCDEFELEIVDSSGVDEINHLIEKYV